MSSSLTADERLAHLECVSLLSCPRRAIDLWLWSQAKLGTAIGPLWSSAQLRARCRERAPHVAVLDAATANEALSALRELSPSGRPEIILLGMTSLDALRLKQRGIPMALELPDPWSLDDLAGVLERVAVARLRLRALANELVQRIELPEALGLLRYYMVSAALQRAGSKQAAARLLGVTRPAVQQLAKSYAIEVHVSS